MKNSPLKILLTNSALILISTVSFANIVTPSSQKMTGYQLWASTSTNCANPVKVIDQGSSGKVIDLAASTDFGSATLPPDGTYECLIVVTSDRYTLIPSVSGTSSGTNDNCVAGTSYIQDTCHTGSTSTLPDGTTTTCGNSTDDKVATFISTAGASGNDGATGATAKKLNASIVVNGGSVDKTLYVSLPNGLVNVSGSCGQDNTAVLGVR